MPNALLLPKLQLPRLPSALVLRKRLFARLDSGLECPLTLIMASAGFGKTTLVRQWLSERCSSGAGCQSLAVAWVSLDAGDNDPVRFWRYVITACQSFLVDQTVLELLHTSVQSLAKPAFLETLLTTFLNALATMPDTGILVLEDYHVLTSPQLHESMAFFLEHLPITLHLMILTRSEPPLSLARLRASGNVCELSATDLRFSQEETLAFLQLAVPQHISEQTLQQLDTRLEGWAVGLRLFALTLQGHVKQQAMEVSLAALNGQQRIILDYFVSEVLLAQPAPLQDFLLQTCMLDRLNSSLCDAVTGRDDSIVQLNTLERANLFLEQLDGPGQWYRYHSLFAEAMQQVARQRLGEERLRVALQQASHWYEQHNMLPEAIEKAIMAEDVARVADLIEQYMDMQRANTPASPLLDTQEFHTLRRWLEYLPATLICQRPHLCIGLATARFLVGVLEQQPFSPQDLAQMEEVLQWAEQGFRLEQNQHRLGEVFLFRALLDRQHGSLTEAVNNARLALDYLPEQEITWRASALGILGLKQLLAGQIERAQQTTLVAREACMMLGYPAIIRTNTVLLSRVYYEHGELHLAAEFYRQMLTEAREQQDYDDIGDAQLGLAQISYAWNDLQAAELQATEVIEMGMRLANEEFQVEGALILARIEHARGEYAAAQQRCLTLLTQQPAVSSQGLSLRYRLHQEIQATLTRFQLASGDLAAVELWAIKRSAYNGEWLLQSEHECLLVARWLLAQEKSGEALAIVEGMPDVARQAGRIRLALEAQLVLALAYASSRRMQDAKQQLQMALTQAYSENYLRLFLDEGEAMAVLLQAILPSVHGKGLIGYIRRILFAFTEGGGSSNTARSVAPVEPLSVQEHRVLFLLAAGRTNPEIATELVVSVNTVKTQVQSIYRKLNVSNRIEASEVARALNLL